MNRQYLIEAMLQGRSKKVYINEKVPAENKIQAVSCFVNKFSTGKIVAVTTTLLLS